MLSKRERTRHVRKISLLIFSTLQGYAKLLVSPFRSATSELSRIAHAKERERGSTCYDTIIIIIIIFHLL
jgi:hypothetical protein